MIADSIFNFTIVSLLENNPKDSISNTIQMIAKKGNYFSEITEFAFKVGIGIRTTGVDFPPSNLTLHFPIIKYYPNNILNHKAEDVVISSIPISIENCYSLLAKELVYRLSRIPTIENYL